MTMLPADVSLVTEPQGAPPVSGWRKFEGLSVFTMLMTVPQFYHLGRR